MKKVYLLAGLSICLATGSVYFLQETVNAQSLVNAAPELTAEEEIKYAKLASKDPKAKEAFEDMKLIAALAANAAQLLPGPVTLNILGGIELNLREWAKPLIYSFYNVAEIGLAVINFMDEQETALVVNSRCAFLFNDDELKGATTRGRKDPINLTKFTIEQCAGNGCPSKRVCVANLLEKSIKAIRPIYDNAVAKYDKDAGTAQAGLLLNAEQAFENVIKSIFSLGVVKAEIAKKGWTEKLEKFEKQLAALRQVLVVGASVFSGALEALQLLVLAIGGKEIIQYLPPGLKEAGEKIIKEGTTIIISDAAIDKMVDDFGLDDY
jgi:hypothetical protein